MLLKLFTASGIAWLLLITQPASVNLRGELVSRWCLPDYAGVLPQIIQYRKTPCGRNIQVDYMIATSLCRLNDNDLNLICRAVVIRLFFYLLLLPAWGYANF
jgi:hypothetical protein